MNTLQNKEVIDFGNVSEAYQVYMLQIFFHTVKFKTLPNFQVNKFSVNVQFPKIFTRIAQIFAGTLILRKIGSLGN